MNASFGRQVKVSAGYSSRNLAQGHCGKMQEIVDSATRTVALRPFPKRSKGLSHKLSCGLQVEFEPGSAPTTIY